MLRRSRGERNPETALFTGRGAQVRTRKLEHGIRLGHAQQDLEQHQPALQVYGDQEIFLGVCPAIFTQLRGKLRMREQVTDLVSATLYGMHQYSSKLMDYLRGYAADRPCDHGLFFP